jgi:hypothetical protein
MPLPEILNEILDIGEKAFGVPVEIEFAVTMPRSDDYETPSDFYLLQIRPLSVHTQETMTDPDKIDKSGIFLYTEQGMGNGVIPDLYDIIYLHPDKFDKVKTLEMQIEIAELNQYMNRMNRQYILIGPGRWGTKDRFLGVPVQWAEINKAKVIVEIGIEGFSVEPSQGTDFFHNLVAMNAGYFAVRHNTKRDFIDWDYLSGQPVIKKTKYFTHVESETPFTVRMFGKSGVAILYKAKPKEE